MNDHPSKHHRHPIEVKMFLPPTLNQKYSYINLKSTKDV